MGWIRGQTLIDPTKILPGFDLFHPHGGDPGDFSDEPPRGGGAQKEDGRRDITLNGPTALKGAPKEGERGKKRVPKKGGEKRKRTLGAGKGKGGAPFLTTAKSSGFRRGGGRRGDWRKTGFPFWKGPNWSPRGTPFGGGHGQGHGAPEPPHERQGGGGGEEKSTGSFGAPGGRPRGPRQIKGGKFSAWKGNPPKPPLFFPNPFFQRMNQSSKGEKR